METETLVSREYALANNLVSYFTGIPCKNGHIDKRYTNSKVCYECKRGISKRNYSRNSKTVKKRNARNFNKEQHLKNSLLWAKNNRQKSNQIKKDYKIRHKEKYKKYCKEYREKKIKDPFVRLSKYTATAIWKCLKDRKNRKTWQTFVNFTLEELIFHLENRFKEGMTWNNYGNYWHLDHKIPISWFDLEKDFNKVWSLDNLQPLEAKLNLSKNNRYKS